MAEVPELQDLIMSQLEARPTSCAAHLEQIRSKNMK